MSKFLPIHPVQRDGGLIAGAIGKKTFELIWGAFDGTKRRPSPSTARSRS